MGRSAWTIVLDAKLVTESQVVIDIGWNNIDWILKPKIRWNQWMISINPI